MSKQRITKLGDNPIVLSGQDIAEFKFPVKIQIREETKQKKIIYITEYVFPDGKVFGNIPKETYCMNQMFVLDNISENIDNVLCVTYVPLISD